MNEIQRNVFYWTKLSLLFGFFGPFERNGQSGPRRSSLVQILLHRPPAHDDIMQKNPLLLHVQPYHEADAVPATLTLGGPRRRCSSPRAPDSSEGQRVRRFTPDGFKGWQLVRRAAVLLFPVHQTQQLVFCERGKQQKLILSRWRTIKMSFLEMFGLICGFGPADPREEIFPLPKYLLFKQRAKHRLEVIYVDIMHQLWCTYPFLLALYGGRDYFSLLM